MKKILRLALLLLLPFTVSAQFTGTYQKQTDAWRAIRFSRTGDTLWFKYDRYTRIALQQRTATTFYAPLGSPAVMDFGRDSNRLWIHQGGKDHEFFLLSRDTTFPVARKESNRKNGFTMRDTLRGLLTPYRTCYDVKYYHLDVEFDIKNESLSGSTEIRFQAMTAFDTLQLDLYENMRIDSIVYRNRHLAYVRRYDAVFVAFPSTVQAGSADAISVYYAGRPQTPDLASPMNGGFLFRRDLNGRPLVQVACQGSGASLWWPNKDHLSDKPDSMLISVTIPDSLQNISNGRLRGKTLLPGNRVRTDWAVTYPMNNYNATVNIGDYRELNDVYIRNNDTLDMRCYYLPYHEERARKLLAQAKPMLSYFEASFGPYPFPRDGFVIMETLYPMEHQSAVALGSFAGSADEKEGLMWHECAHEWWGNAVTIKDMADFWLHEGFATYATAQMLDWMRGRKALEQFMKEERWYNNEPVIGVYNVNHIFYETGDLYNKGCRILMNLNKMIGDEQFFALLKAIQNRYRYQCVSNDEMITFINQFTKSDLTAFFDQFLRTTVIPELAYGVVREEGQLKFCYKWQHVRDDFQMPVLVKLDGIVRTIHPGTSWKYEPVKKSSVLLNTDGKYFNLKKVDKPD